MSWGFRDQSNCVLSSVPNRMEITASNFSKQRPLMIPTGPIQFPQNTNFNYNDITSSQFDSLYELLRKNYKPNYSGKIEF